MSGKIYNNRGQVIGEYESESERNAREEGWCCMMVAMPFMLIMIAPVILVLAAHFGPWGMLAYLHTPGEAPPGLDSMWSQLAGVLAIAMTLFYVKRAPGIYTRHRSSKWYVKWLLMELWAGIRLLPMVALMTVVYVAMDDPYMLMEYAEVYLQLCVIVGLGCPVLPTTIILLVFHKNPPADVQNVKSNNKSKAKWNKIGSKTKGTSTSTGICPRCGGLTENGVCRYCGTKF